MKKVNKKKIISKKKIVKALKPVKKAKVLVTKKIVKKPTSVKNSTKQKKKIISKPVKKVVVKKAVKKITKRIVKKVVNNSIEGFPAEALFKAKIKVIGVGGGGGSIVSEIGRSLEKATFVIADTDIRALKKKSGIKYFWFGEELTHGLGTGVNVDLAKQAATAAKEKISGLFKDQDIIIFIASLGGGLGSGATQVFAEAAKEFGGITFGIFTMPFKFEGKNKYRIAQNALKVLRQSLNVSLVIPNEKIFKIIDTSTPITNAFSVVNKSLMESLESLIDLIYNPGVINIDFADIRTILKGRGNSAFLNTIEESGKDRVEKTCQNIFNNPLLQNNNFKAEKILFNIAGSENLSMFEVEKISSHISELNQKSKIIFGISKDSKLNNKIKTTILMTGGASGVKLESDVLALAPIKKVSTTKVAVIDKIIEKNKIIKEKTIKSKEKKQVVDKKAIIKKAEKIDKKISISKDIAVVNKKSAPEVKEKIIVKKGKPIILLPETQTAAIIPVSVLDKKKDNNKDNEELNKKTIRRSGLEIKEAEELEELKKIDQEKEWEIPAFLRKVKFKG